ncbi:MAG: hypothetical protein ACREX0_20135, partial [Noviherbaspirillum sp.]
GEGCPAGGADPCIALRFLTQRTHRHVARAAVHLIFRTDQGQLADLSLVRILLIPCTFPRSLA